MKHTNGCSPGEQHNTINSIQIDLGTHGIKMTRQQQFGSTARVPIADKYGEIIIKNLIGGDEWIGNELLHHYPGSSGSSGSSPIIYGITKHLRHSSIPDDSAQEIVVLLTRLFTYLVTLIEDASFQITVLQQCEWSPRGVQLLCGAIDNMRLHGCGSMSIVPFDAMIQQCIKTTPFVLIDFGETVRCMHCPNKVYDQLDIGGNDFTKLVVKMLRRDMTKQGLARNSFKSLKLRHKLWVFAEKVKRV